MPAAKQCFFDEVFINNSSGNLSVQAPFNFSSASVTQNGGYSPGGASAAGNLSISGNSNPVLKLGLHI
ncbi:MAG: hypothetical protein R3C26_23680 [Calditrichia bacterium]